MVSNLSFRFSIFLALIMAGTAQAKPLIIGITLFPFSPTLRISLSDKKTDTGHIAGIFQQGNQSK